MTANGFLSIFSASEITFRFLRLYQEEKKKNPKAPSSRRVLFRSITTRFILAFVACTLSFVMALVGPVSLILYGLSMSY